MRTAPLVSPYPLSVDFGLARVDDGHASAQPKLVDSKRERVHTRNCYDEILKKPPKPRYIPRYIRHQRRKTTPQPHPSSTVVSTVVEKVPSI